MLRTFYSLFQLFSKNAILLEVSTAPAINLFGWRRRWLIGRQTRLRLRPQWIHIFVPQATRTRFFWFCWAVIAINTMLYISFIFTTHFRCVPREKMWFPWVSGRCIDMYATDITIMVFNLACDILILLLPQSTIWSLQLQRRQKLGLSFLFSLGLL